MQTKKHRTLSLAARHTLPAAHSCHSPYLLAMRPNAVPRPEVVRFFHALWSSLRPCGGMRLLLAEREQAGQTRTIAGSILMQFGQTVFYAFTGCSPERFLSASSRHSADCRRFEVRVEAGFAGMTSGKLQR